jgi:hypothetical protein
MQYDYSDAPPPRGPELIPPGTIATVVVHIRPGGVGEDELLKRSSKGDCEMLDLELVLVDGDHARRKFWQNQIINGSTPEQQDMAERHRHLRKQFLQSARNIMPNDTSPQARAAYLADLKDFEGMMFMVKIGIEKAKPRNDGSGENYPDKNIIAAVITPDKKEYHPIMQTPPFNGGGASGGTSVSPAGSPSAPTNPPIEPPSWAR